MIYVLVLAGVSLLAWPPVVLELVRVEREARNLRRHYY